MAILTNTGAWPRASQWLAVTALMAACGGGGGGADSPPSPSPTPAAVKPTTLKGTAAKGAAIASGSVAVKCLSGSASATTGADGSFSVDLSAATAPCVLRVTAADGSQLHSVVVAGSSSTVTANVTPATELVVARLVGSAPGSYFDTFGAGAELQLTAVKVQAADAAIVTMLKNVGVDLSGVGGALAGTLVAANGATAGNAYDLALDRFNTVLAAAGTTLASYTAQVVGSSPVAPQGDAVPALPPDLLLSPAAAGCPSMRSGNYWWAVSGGGIAKAQLDATTLQVAMSSPFNGQSYGGFTLASDGGCRFHLGPMNWAWTASGLAVFESDLADVPGFHGGLLIPQQTIAPFELAGDWNFVGWDEAGSGPPQLASFTVTIDGTGTVTTANVCPGGYGGCRPVASGSVISSNPRGSLDVRESDGSYKEAFAFRSGSGQLMMLLSMPKTYLVGVRKSTLAMPAVGQVTQALTLQMDTVSTSLSQIVDTRSVVTAVDSANSRYTRTLTLNASTGLTRPEDVVLNDPSAGFRHRPAASVTASDGSTSAVLETVTLDLPGIGLGATLFVGRTAMQLSVAR